MTAPEIHEEVEVPEDVTVTIDGFTLEADGLDGTLDRTLRHPDIDVNVEDDTVVVHADFPDKKTRALAKTWASHVRNMVRGVSEPFEYELSIVYSHFPIKARVDGDTFVVENFLGERHHREAEILPNVDVEVDGEEVYVRGPDREKVGQTAANIEQSTKVQGYDPRIFQDGIYITSKGA
jgi:large subunit ribosomal protein L6